MQRNLAWQWKRLIQNVVFLYEFTIRPFSSNVVCREKMSRILSESGVSGQATLVWKSLFFELFRLYVPLLTVFYILRPSSSS